MKDSKTPPKAFSVLGGI